MAFAQHSVTFAKSMFVRSGYNVDFGQPSRHFVLLVGRPTPPSWETPLGHLRSLFWNYTLAVLLNSEFHHMCKSLILNNPPTLVTNLWYWPFILAVDFEATLHQFYKILIFTTSRGSVILKNTPLLFVTYCYWPLPWQVYFWTTVHWFCVKTCILKHVLKCIFEQHSVTLRILTSKYFGKIGLCLFWRPTVLQLRRVDINLSS